MFAAATPELKRCVPLFHRFLRHSLRKKTSAAAAAAAAAAAVKEFDRLHLWHPYSCLTNPSPVMTIQSAAGCTLTTDQGHEMLDAMSSWWAACWGYRHAVLDNAIREQVDKNMSHVMFGGLTHAPAVNLGQRLLQLLNHSSTADDDHDDGPLSCIFYTDSGSVATEVALKMAWQAVDNKRRLILTCAGGYHGDTLGAMHVSDPVNAMHVPYFGHVITDKFTRATRTRPPAAWQYSLLPQQQQHDDDKQQAIADLENLFHQHAAHAAAFIVEPLVQGAGGMYFYEASYLQRVRQLCTEYDVLLILDEIATGFGRTGGNSLFAFRQANIQPDIICVGKALTAGYMTLGAAVCTRDVAERVSGGKDCPMMHGPTFMGNPLACAVGTASADLLVTKEPGTGQPAWQSQVNRIEQQLQQGLQPATELPGVQDVRVRGAVGVIELKQPLDMTMLPQMCLDHGVWLRPFGKLLYTMPPYIMTNDQVHKVTTAMAAMAAANDGPL